MEGEGADSAILSLEGALAGGSLCAREVGGPPRPISPGANHTHVTRQGLGQRSAKPGQRYYGRPTPQGSTGSLYNRDGRHFLRLSADGIQDAWACIFYPARGSMPGTEWTRERCSDMLARGFRSHDSDAPPDLLARAVDASDDPHKLIPQRVPSKNDKTTLAGIVSIDS